MNANNHSIVTHDFAATFLLKGLWTSLQEFGVGTFEADPLIQWYHRTASTWPEQISQIAFDEYARRQIGYRVGFSRGQVESKVEKITQPVSESDIPWSPCVHWGGVRTCPRCDPARREIVAGSMVRADAMYRDNDFWGRNFARKRIWIELFPFMHGAVCDDFDDIESKVWTKVAANIDQYHPQINTKTGKATPLAWLKTVVHSVVVDHFQNDYRKKRDVRRVIKDDQAKVTRQFDRSSTRVSHPKPTRPAGEGSDSRK